MTTDSYTVQGMTCTSCAASVTAEVEAIPGVSSVDVISGQVHITSDVPVTESQVRDAVEEAGYRLALQHSVQPASERPPTPNHRPASPRRTS
jgi:copper chaperone CopZ